MNDNEVSISDSSDMGQNQEITSPLRFMAFNDHSKTMTHMHCPLSVTSIDQQLIYAHLTTWKIGRCSSRLQQQLNEANVQHTKFPRTD